MNKLWGAYMGDKSTSKYIHDLNGLVERRKRQRELFPNGETLPEICLNLRASLNGSADSWQEGQAEVTLSLLQQAIDTYLCPVDPIDAAVLSMLHATVYCTSTDVPLPTLKRTGPH